MMLLWELVMYKDTDSFVVCQICGKEYKQIGTGHVKSHNLTMAQYRLQFPNAPLVCKAKKDVARSTMKAYAQKEGVLTKYRQRAKKFWSDPDNKVRMCESFKKRPKQSDIVIKKISDTMKKRYAEGSKLKQMNDLDNFSNRLNPLIKLGRYKQLSSMETFVFNILKPYGFMVNFPVVSNESRKRFFYIDFALPDKKIGIELDSEIHDKESVMECDIRKNKGLINLSWRLFRIRFNSRSARKFIKVQEELLGILTILNIEA